MTFLVSPQQPSNGNDAAWMLEALKVAEVGATFNEVPVGAIIVRDEKIIARANNRPIAAHDPTAHAEILALRAAGLALGNYRLNECTLYVTLEPCLMCVGAMVHARIKRLVFGAYDAKSGAVSSQMQALDLTFFNHKISHTGGVLAENCKSILQSFFIARRAYKKMAKQAQK